MDEETATPAAPVKREALEDFLAGYLPGKRGGMKAAFRVYAGAEDWERATRGEWIERFEAFAARPA